MKQNKAQYVVLRSQNQNKVQKSRNKSIKQCT